MGFPQYLIPPPFCQMKSQLSDTSLYPAVPSPACFGQQYCSLLLLVQGECLWIIWLCNLGDQVHLQNQRHLKLSAGFLVVYVDFATFLSGRRKTAACLLFSVSLLDVMRLSVLYSVCQHWRQQPALLFFLPLPHGCQTGLCCMVHWTWGCASIAQGPQG